MEPKKQKMLEIDYTDVRTVARRLDLCPRTVVNWIEKGLLRGVKVGGQKRRWRVEISSVEEMLKRGKNR